MATKQEILLKALEHFSQKGYATTTLDEIAKDLNITKPAIYYHYKNKMTLYNEIFKYFFDQITFVDQQSLEKNIIHYIDVLSHLFLQNPQFAKLFSKELANEGKNLQEETLKITSKTIKFLSNALKKTSLNPFFIQTLVISSFTTYLNTVELRKKVTGITNITTSDFDVKEEIETIITNYIKAHQ